MDKKCTCPPISAFTPLPDYHCPIHGAMAADGFETKVVFESKQPKQKPAR